MSFYLRPAHLWILGSTFMLLYAPQAMATKGSAMVYEDPFDLGSGGASLTRASGGAIPISNPALIPFGNGFHRWVGIEPAVIVGKDSIEFAKGMKNAKDSSASELVTKVFKAPVHAGVQNAISYLNKYGGFTVFDRVEPDLRAQKYGPTGLPAIKFGAESYHGVAFSGAKMLIPRTLAFGVTGKYLYAADENRSIELTDQEALKKVQTTSGIKSLVSHNKGFGYDAGMLYFLQGYNFDWRLALKADDIGGTKLTGDGSLKTLPAMYSAGLGMTLHNGTDSINVALDYRDIRDAYKEAQFKRMRAGLKLLMRRYVGLGVGIMDGWPTYAAEIDLILMRVKASFYTRELGDSPGVEPRPIYSAGIAMGF